MKKAAETDTPFNLATENERLMNEALRNQDEKHRQALAIEAERKRKEEEEWLI